MTKVSQLKWPKTRMIKPFIMKVERCTVQNDGSQCIENDEAGMRKVAAQLSIKTGIFEGKFTPDAKQKFSISRRSEKD